MDIRFEKALVHANVHPFGTTTFDITYDGRVLKTGLKPEELIAMAYPAIVQLAGGVNVNGTITPLDSLTGKPLDGGGQSS